MSSTWFSDSPRTIPLQPFGYPDNDELRHDLGAFAPHLRRFTEARPYPQD